MNAEFTSTELCCICINNGKHTNLKAVTEVSTESGVTIKYNVEM